MSEFSDQVEPEPSGYGLSLLLLALGLGVLTIRMKHQQQMEQLVEVTKDFTTFQATFMSEQTCLGSATIGENQVTYRPTKQPLGVTIDHPQMLRGFSP